MNNKYVVYIHICPNNKKYIGITSCKNPNRRWQSGKGYVGSKYFYNAINKYGWENIEHIIMAENLTEIEAKQMEVNLIYINKSNNRKYGYNISIGGESACGILPTEETRRKISENRKGKCCGKDSHRYGIRCVGIDNPNKKAIICLNTLETFDVMLSASKKYNIDKTSLTKCCKGKIKSAGKYPITGEKLVWMYYDEYININL